MNQFKDAARLAAHDAGVKCCTAATACVLRCAQRLIDSPCKGRQSMNQIRVAVVAAVIAAGFTLASQAQNQTQPPMSAASQAQIQAEEEKHEITQPEANYHAGGSPLANEPMHPNANPKAPKMSEAEFEIGRKTYFERCA
ncbi:MAG: hypothetical protein ABI696_15860, partial [Rubrivivax sp.]